MSVSAWYAFLVFCAFLITVITLHTRSMRFLNFMLFGSVAGFLFDYSAVSLGFYGYNQFIDATMVEKIPVTVSFAEGVGMSSVIFVFELIWKRLGN